MKSRRRGEGVIKITVSNDTIDELNRLMKFKTNEGSTGGETTVCKILVFALVE